jgi:hypothetical protein
MAFTERPPSPPIPNQPVIDASGRMNKIWYDYFVALSAYLARMAASIP